MFAAFRWLLLLALVPSVFGKCTNPGHHADLRNPPSTMLNLTKGSFIIPMDNAQNIGSTFFGGGGSGFNMQVYGLIFRLLWADIPLHWVIKGCKRQNDYDARNVKVRQVLPKWTSSTGTRSFREGFLVLPYMKDHRAAYLTGFLPKVYTQFARFSPYDPVVFHVEETLAEEVEVRHTWRFRPKVAVAGMQNTDIHETVMREAGLIKNKHWSHLTNSFESRLNANSCYTFVCNPHDNLDTAKDRAKAVAKFLRSGGNFLAQCHGVRSYGQRAAEGFGGTQLLLPRSSPTISDGGGLSGNTLRLQQPDLAYAQIQVSAGFNYKQGGSWDSGSISGVRNRIESTTYFELTDGDNFKAMAGTVRDYPRDRKTGGMVYFLGGHKYEGGESAKNGRRMLLNAAIVPASERAGACGLEITLPPTSDAPTKTPTKLPTRSPTNSPTLSPVPAKFAPDRRLLSSNFTASDSEAKPGRRLLSTVDQSLLCPGGTYPHTCDWADACSTKPSCVVGSSLACFPDYCDPACKPKWMNINSGTAVSAPCITNQPTAKPTEQPTTSKQPTNRPTTRAPSKKDDTSSPTRDPTKFPTTPPPSPATTASNPGGSGLVGVRSGNEKGPATASVPSWFLIPVALVGSLTIMA